MKDIPKITAAKTPPRRNRSETRVVCDRQGISMPVEILSDGRTVWVNNASSSIGRFSANGVDVHNSAEAQAQGAPECLDCTHDLPFEAAWARFKTSMLQFYNVSIDDKHKPSDRNRYGHSA